jgi:hypothetical protein
VGLRPESQKVGRHERLSRDDAVAFRRNGQPGRGRRPLAADAVRGKPSH